MQAQPLLRDIFKEPPLICYKRGKSEPNCEGLNNYAYVGVVWVSLGVKTCEGFLCFVTIMFVLSFVLTSLFSLFYVTREGDRFLHRG